MRQKIDFIGKLFGSLTVVEELPKRYQRMFKCHCACGGSSIVSYGHLSTGHTQSCGCHNKVKIQDGFYPEVEGAVYAGFVCTGNKKRIGAEMGLEVICPLCSDIFVTLPRRLLSGNTTSCGCKKRQEAVGSMLGGRFGKLTVEEFSHRNEANRLFFKCRCDCGNLHVTSGEALRRYDVKSCGCLTPGEAKEFPISGKALYCTHRSKEDELYAFIQKILSNTRAVLRGKYNSTTPHKLFSCSVGTLKTKLGITDIPEENRKDWTIDHICPISQANNKQEVLKLSHWSNLILLRRMENIHKGDKKTTEGEVKCRELLGREWDDRNRY